MGHKAGQQRQARVTQRAICFHCNRSFDIELVTVNESNKLNSTIEYRCPSCSATFTVMGNLEIKVIANYFIRPKSVGKLITNSQPGLIQVRGRKLVGPDGEDIKR